MKKARSVWLLTEDSLARNGKYQCGICATANRSYHAIETDIHRTADGKFVISHDSNLERVSGEKITIGSSILSELQIVVLFDKDGTKNRLDLCPPTHSAQYLFSNVTEDKIERAIVDKIDLDIEWKSLSKEYIDRFHAAGLVVNCWTVNSVEIAEKMIDMGIDYITTNILE